MFNADNNDQLNQKIQAIDKNLIFNFKSYTNFKKDNQELNMEFSAPFEKWNILEKKKASYFLKMANGAPLNIARKSNDLDELIDAFNTYVEAMKDSGYLNPQRANFQEREKLLNLLRTKLDEARQVIPKPPNPHMIFKI